MSIETASSLLDPSLLRFRESLEACAQPLDDGSESNKAVAKVVEILNSISHVPQSENDVSQYDDENLVPDYSISEEALHEVYQCLSNSHSKQMVIDVLSMDLPQVACRMGTLSDKCHKIAKIIIELFVSTCNPRDMIAILCEIRIMQIVI